MTRLPAASEARRSVPPVAGASAEFSEAVNRLTVHPLLKHFVEDEVLSGLEMDAPRFWSVFAQIVQDFSARNRQLLADRQLMQEKIDAWHQETTAPVEPEVQRAFLKQIGYLVDQTEPEPVSVGESDPEVSLIAGPQLVVPGSNARYTINAINARWGSLYDAVYGTDVLGDRPQSGSYDPERGARVVAWSRDFLDRVFPLKVGSHADVVAYEVGDVGMVAALDSGASTTLEDEKQFVAFEGPRDSPNTLMLRNHGLRVLIEVDRDSVIGRADPAGVRDVVLEAAITTIVDFEDSVAAVDVEDKLVVYRNWLGLMRGDLEVEVEKNGETNPRRMAPDRVLERLDGSPENVPGRALMLVRNVGLLMTTNAVLDEHGNEIPEELLDAAITVACALRDVKEANTLSNSRTGLIYIVKPKLHGPEEVTYVDDLFEALEESFGLAHATIRVGIMDEERRTSVNLGECIRRVSSRIAFINTGFLDRTGDEIRTSTEAGPMVRKQDMKSQPWIRAYENRNVDIGLQFGLRGRAQIGKGMWAKPDEMAAMMEEKIGHPEQGATCAWVPSPTAATLHAIHYHDVDVVARQSALEGEVRESIDNLLRTPLADLSQLEEEDRINELENNAQGILGYVVRWVDQGIGCSKVPDIDGVALMEDRATCRISSQHMGNWLRHGVTTEEEVRDVMARMASIVDQQNHGDPAYVPMMPSADGPAFRAALSLVLDGRSQPSGYTEPILHASRREAKSLTGQPRSQNG